MEYIFVSATNYGSIIANSTVSVGYDSDRGIPTANCYRGGKYYYYHFSKE